MTAIFNYLDKLFSEPESWDLQRMVHEEALKSLIDAYADSKPRTLEQITLELQKEFPYLKDNTEVIEMGNNLYAEVIENLKATAENDPNGTDPLPELTEDRAKLLERKIILFNKVVEMRQAMQAIGLHITGTSTKAPKQKNEKQSSPSITDQPGAAQKFLRGQL